MPLLVLSEKHKKDLTFLKRIDPDTLEQFCALSVGFAKEGFDSTKFHTAATKFGLSPEPLKRALESLCYLFIESAKINLSDIDFADSLIVLAFPDAIGEVLRKYFFDNIRHFRDILGELKFDVPHYHDLDWRLDVLLASRALRNQVKPVFLLKLTTEEENGKLTSRHLEASATELRHVCNELEIALNEVKAGYVRKTMRTIK